MAKDKKGEKEAPKEKKKLTKAQHEGLKKGRIKGQKLMAEARKIQKAAGTKTVTKTVHKMSMADAMKKVSKK